MRCAVSFFPGHTAFAGSVQQACLSAGSSKANYHVCRCIQSAADATLHVKDQSLAAAIIRNPDNVTEKNHQNDAITHVLWSDIRNLVNWRGLFVPKVKDARCGYRSAAK